MSDRYITKRDKKTTTNLETGEILEQETEETVSVGKTPPFVMVFLKDLSNMQSLTKAENKVLWGLLADIDNKNIISLTKGLKDQVADDYGLKKGSMNTIIYNLKKKKVIIEIAKGRVQPNPYHFGRGKWKDISKLRQTTEYDFKKGTKATEVVSS